MACDVSPVAMFGLILLGCGHHLESFLMGSLHQKSQSGHFFLFSGSVSSHSLLNLTMPYCSPDEIGRLQGHPWAQLLQCPRSKTRENIQNRFCLTNSQNYLFVRHISTGLHNDSIIRVERTELVGRPVESNVLHCPGPLVVVHLGQLL